MNQNVGASFTLSVLTVAFFAVALYQPDRPPKAQGAVAGASNRGGTNAPTPAPVVVEARPPEEGPGIKALPAPVPVPVRPAPLHETAARTELPPTRSFGVMPASRSRVASRPVVAAQATPTTPTRTAALREPAPAAEPRGAFTHVRPGESLGDVARRVYGSDGSVESLWRANRDQVARQDAPLRVGALLRTP